MEDKYIISVENTIGGFDDIKPNFLKRIKIIWRKITKKLWTKAGEQNSQD